MGKYKKPVFIEEKMKNNPFVFGLQIPVTMYEDRYKYILDMDGALLNQVLNLEYDKSIKVYVSSERRKTINQLNPNACKLLKWVEQELDSNKDFFWLNKERYMDETGVAYNTYKKSVMELQTFGFIAKSATPDIFWLNPHFFFMGNRVKKYEDKVKIVNELTGKSI